MRKTNDGLQIQTALEKAEQRLHEAIESARKEAERQNLAKDVITTTIQDAIAEFQSSSIENDGESEIPERESGIRQLYGFSPKLSRSEAIEKDLDGVSDEKKQLLTRILGSDAIRELEEDAQADGGDKQRHYLIDDEFHDVNEVLEGKESTDKVLGFFGEVANSYELLEESEEYQIKSFDEENDLQEDNYDFEWDDIMPQNFALTSFDDEDEAGIVPYDINKALILGEPFPQEFQEDMAEEPQLEVLTGKIKSDAERILSVTNGTKEERLAQIQKENDTLKAEAIESAEKILEKARMEAKEILRKAEEEAKARISEKVEEAQREAEEKGYAAGFEKGQNQGYLEAEDAVNVGMVTEAAAFREHLEQALEDFRHRKHEILENSLNDLTHLAVTIAEKVIKVSLKSSKDVVTKMIVAAAEDCRNKEWAKVYISHEDKVITMHLESDLIDALNQISDSIKVVVMEDEPSGTCIIESPGQIVDASVSTQLEAIRQIVDDNEL